MMIVDLTLTKIERDLHQAAGEIVLQWGWLKIYAGAQVSYLPVWE